MGSENYRQKPEVVENVERFKNWRRSEIKAFQGKQLSQKSQWHFWSKKPMGCSNSLIQMKNYEPIDI